MHRGWADEETTNTNNPFGKNIMTMKMNRWLVSAVGLMACLFGRQAEAREVQTVRNHPRLLMTEEMVPQVRQAVAECPDWARLHAEVLAAADEMMDAPLLTYRKKGMRLLPVSREALRRIFFLSYAYRMSREEGYFERAKAELDNVCAFRDWNPSHFLDVAEMTVAVAIGYDWLYDRLDELARFRMYKSIVEKGIQPSFRPGWSWWLNVSHNWNQVCNAGMVMGALAVYERDPGWFRQVVGRSLHSARLPMEDYAPDGAYAEGYSYWAFGTTFHVLLLDALQTAGLDAGATSPTEAFWQSASFFEHATDLQGDSFNYADCGEEYGLTPAMFWFARERRDPSLLWMERTFMDARLRENRMENRLLPAAIVWGCQSRPGQATPPAARTWSGGGTTPVAFMHASWEDPEAFFVGLKGGTASSNHAHMDAGSFVVEKEGVRWCMDLGREGYTRLEAAGLTIWSNDQCSDRWKVFRYNNRAHNTLTVDDALHRVEGRVPLLYCYEDEHRMAAAVDLTSVLPTHVGRAIRRLAVVDGKTLYLRDELTSTMDSVRAKWTMLTPAAVEQTADGGLLLTKEGKHLYVKADGPFPLRFRVREAVSLQPFDTPNKGCRVVTIEWTQPPHRTATLDVRMASDPEDLKPQRRLWEDIEQTIGRNK